MSRRKVKSFLRDIYHSRSDPTVSSLRPLYMQTAFFYSGEDVTSEKPRNLMGASFDCDEHVFLGAHAEVFGIVEHVGGIA